MSARVLRMPGVDVEPRPLPGRGSRPTPAIARKLARLQRERPHAAEFVDRLLDDLLEDAPPKGRG